MPYPELQFRVFANITVPQKCGDCKFAQDSVSTGITALNSLRATYDERPGHVSSRDKGCWVKTSTDLEQGLTNRRYAALVAAYGGSTAVRNDIVNNCDGGTWVNTVGEPSQHWCGYNQNQPIPEDLPPLI